MEEVFGQNISRLSDVVDVFEVMSYHQILRRDAEWPAAIGTDIKRRCKGKVICTLQAKALYLHGMHSVGTVTLTCLRMSSSPLTPSNRVP